jgi:broad specificity phosphatase PhoE
MAGVASLLQVVIVQHADKQRLPGDPGLTALGREQAATTAGWIAENLTVTALWSSPLRRALETAGPVSEATGLRARTDDRLRERMNWDDPAQSVRDFELEWIRSSGDRDFVPAFGDSSRTAARRFLRFLEDIVRQQGTVVVVSHGGITVDLLRTLVGDDAVRSASPRLIDSGVPSCALTRLSRCDGWSVEGIAWTGHLGVRRPRQRG